MDYIQEFEKRVKQLDVDSAAENRATFVAALREGIREEGEISRLLSILAFVEGCDYSKHPGGGATSAYVNHLLRVANFSLEFFTENKEEAVVLSLVHNMYEVSDVSEAGLAEVVGEGLARAVTLLSVDRSRQWDAGYKAGYYKTLEESGPVTSGIKVLDKLDNIFLIGRQSDKDIQRKYLKEIEEFVIPLARGNQSMPGVARLMEEMLSSARNVCEV